MNSTIKKFTRTITVEVIYTDDKNGYKGHEWVNQFDELTETSTHDLTQMERNTQLSEWFKHTEYTLIDDVMTEVEYRDLPFQSNGKI